MDKVIFDFDNDEFTLYQNGREINQKMPGLKIRKAEILASAGIIQIDLSEMRDLIQDLMEGQIEMEEFLEKGRVIIEDSIKSGFPKELN